MAAPTTALEIGAQQKEAIFALRDRLVRDVKHAKKGKGSANGSSQGQAEAR